MIVTILILIDGFLQYGTQKSNIKPYYSHNPYFNRWFSAIIMRWFMVCHLLEVTILILIDGFLQSDKKTTFAHEYVVTILILIDGFLQL